MYSVDMPDKGMLHIPAWTEQADTRFYHIPLLYTFASVMAQLVKNLQCRRPGFDPWVGKIPWRRERLPTPVFWPGEFNGLHSPWGCKEWDTTEQLSLHFTSAIWGQYPVFSHLEFPKGSPWGVAVA